MRNRSLSRGFLCGVAMCLSASSAMAADPSPLQPDPTRFGQAVFAFGGIYTAEDMAQSANLFGSEYEDNVTAGLGYQYFFYETPSLISLGAEVGIAGRFGEQNSAELWSGLVARYDGLVLFDTVRISPALAFGLSAVTDTLTGRESTLETATEDGDASLLFYLGPEINLSLADHPEAEVFWRLHHRSGAWETLGNLEGAANANVFGLRLRF